MNIVTSAFLAKNLDARNVGIRKEFSDVGVSSNARCVTFVISTQNPDRSGDVVHQDGWDLEAFRKNPVVLWNHNQGSGQMPVGKCTDINVVGTSLIATVEFIPEDFPVAGPFAEGVLRCLKSGFLNACSVGFLPTEFRTSQDPERDYGMDFLQQQLCEFSICCVPDNAEALLLPPVPPFELAAPNKSAALNNIETARVRRARHLKLLIVGSAKPEVI